MEIKEFTDQLEKLKGELESAVTTKARNEIEAQIKAINEKATLSADEAKKAMDNLKKENEEANKTVTELKAWKAEKETADAENQKVIDAYVKERKENKNRIITGEKPESFEQVLKSTMEDPENEAAFKEFVRKGAKRDNSLTMQLKAVADMTFGVQFASAATSVTTLRSGVVMQPNRKKHVRELLPIGTMTGSSITYLTEGAGEGAPATVAEGALKPQFDLDLIENVAQSQYIAGWLRMSRKMMDDVPGMTSFLNARLPEKLLLAEDTQLISGTGTSPQLKGLTTAGNFTAAPGAATIDVEQLIDALAAMDAGERSASAIVVNPTDWWNFFKNKAATSGEYDLPLNVTFANGTLQIGGVPIYATSALAADKFIVGDFQQGAQLLVREAPSIVFSYEDGINIRENMVTVRIEERVAFLVFGASYFYYGDFGNLP